MQSKEPCSGKMQLKDFKTSEFILVLTIHSFQYPHIIQEKGDKTVHHPIINNSLKENEFAKLAFLKLLQANSSPQLN